MAPALPQPGRPGLPRERFITMRKVVRAFAALAFAVLALSACDNDDLPPAAGYAPVSGTITDAATQKPIAGATVIVDTVLTTTTDDKGTFSIAKVPSGIIDYVVQAKGYSDVVASGNVEPGKTFELNVAMQLPKTP
jgi:predicted small lipoprotein YifL